MLTGIILLEMAVFCAAFDGGNGSTFGATALLLSPLAITVFIVGVIKNN